MSSFQVTTTTEFILESDPFYSMTFYILVCPVILKNIQYNMETARVPGCQGTVDDMWDVRLAYTAVPGVRLWLDWSSVVARRQTGGLQVCSFRSRGGSWSGWAAGGQPVQSAGLARPGRPSHQNTKDWVQQDAVSVNTILITHQVNHQPSTAIFLKRICWSVYIKQGNYLIIS